MTPHVTTETASDNSLKSRLDVAITREAMVSGELGAVFDFVAAQDVLPKILTGYAILPAVVSTSNVSGPWDRPGSTRTVHFSDGSTAHEGVTQYDRPSYFAYRVSDPSFSLKHLMFEARGEFWFERSSAGTRVKWTYTFKAKDPLRKAALTVFVRTLWKGYMDVCLRNIVTYFRAR